jgi:hypothetical protein
MRKFNLYIAGIFLLIGCSSSLDGELIFVEPGSEDDFQFPYFLFIPDGISLDQEVFVVIEPNNSGFADDNFKKHIEKAGRTASRDFYTGNYIAQALDYPLLVPVFPRSLSHWKIYTHALDRDALLQKDNDLERLDLQLIAMFYDARSRLDNKSIQTKDQFLLTGFSASGTLQTGLPYFILIKFCCGCRWY